ncbi:MAG: ABC transporter ATP-binding protein [Candidatus Ventricola sp.]|nr:ABC transporter ATP-binding protein [Candidatus Ventricola sp.]MDY3832428.1 ABC transporter ATP-binding protein [Candidatus Ventricola sp.]
MEDKNEKLLQIEDLHIHYMSEGRKVCAVNGVSFEIGAGETIGLVGETGAGKTTMALAIMKLIQKPAGRYAGGRILFGGEDLITASENRMHSIRGNQIAMIFQDPMTSLNPVYTVGDQIAEVVALHQKVSAQQAAERAAEVLELVGIPKERADEYPHQFSGGMKQRVCIAMALAANPQLLIADEPTTALDVTIQAQVLDLMGKLKRELNTAMILITHDLGIVSEVCDKVAIMYAGRIIEFGTLEDIYRHPTHPYTLGLFGSIPKLDQKIRRLTPIKGLMPDPTNLPEGCAFAPRCNHACEACRSQLPPTEQINGSHAVACLRWRELSETKQGGQ